MTRPRPISEVLASARAGDELGAPFGASVVVVDLDAPFDGAEAAMASALLAQAPVVVVGVAVSARSVPEDLVDVLVCASGPAPRPWVVGDVDDLVDAIEGSPSASVAAAQLLRTGAVIDVADAVVAESFVYSLLQAGPDHQRWLAEHGRTDRRSQPDHAVVVRRAGDRLEVVLDRPEVRNAYGTRMRDQLCAALSVAESDPSIGLVELSGTGPVFCSGGDLDEFGTSPGPVPAHLVRTTRNAGIALSRISERVVARVHGRCVGAGVELPAFAGRVVAASDATFRLPEVAMGLVPGAGGTASIPRRIGRHRALWLTLTGVELELERALEWGLVDAIEGGAR